MFFPAQTASVPKSLNAVKRRSQGRKWGGVGGERGMEEGVGSRLATMRWDTDPNTRLDRRAHMEGVRIRPGVPMTALCLLASQHMIPGYRLAKGGCPVWVGEWGFNTRATAAAATRRLLLSAPRAGALLGGSWQSGEQSKPFHFIPHQVLISRGSHFFLISTPLRQQASPRPSTETYIMFRKGAVVSSEGNFTIGPRHP